MKTLIIGLVFGLSLNVVIGQDYHYSQYFQNALSLNPALAGQFKEDYRISMIHRSQWRGIDASFNSTAAGFDMNIKEGFLNRDKIGVGIHAYNDQLGEGIITNNSAFLTLAYHHTLDHHKHHHLSGGVQLGYVNKRMNTDNFQFGNQYQFFVYNPDLPNFENLENNNINYIDLQAGLDYRFTLNDQWKFETGISTFRLSNPVESINVDSLADNRLRNRYVASLGATYHPSGHFTFYPKVLIVSQSGASEITPGILVGYDFGGQHTTTVYGGGFWRTRDALIFMTGLKYRNIEIMGSYDMTTSSLNSLENAQGITRSGNAGAYEISVNIIGIINRSVPAQYTVPCGIF